MTARISEVPIPSAYDDGLNLRRAMVGVYSADTQRELDADSKGYDDVAVELNRRYSNIIVTIAEADAAP